MSEIVIAIPITMASIAIVVILFLLTLWVLEETGIIFRIGKMGSEGNMVVEYVWTKRYFGRLRNKTKETNNKNSQLNESN